VSNAGSLVEPRRFRLLRIYDPVGVSGTGIVAYGVEWMDGTCVLRWTSNLASTAVYNSIQDVQSIHSHSGWSAIDWIDPEVPAE